MPSIIRNKEQDEALETIDRTLKEIEALNATLGNPESVYTVSDKKAKFRTEIAGKGAEKLQGILTDKRKDLVRMVKGLASKYKIEFDDREKAVLSGKTGNKDEKTEAAQEIQTICSDEKDKEMPEKC